MDFSLEIHSLTKKYDKRIILDNIDLKIPKGSFNLLVGNNGSGKTTLLKTISGLIKPSNGEVIYEDNLQIGYQLENLNSKLEIKIGDLLDYLFGLAANSKIDKDHLHRLLYEFGLDNFKQHKVSELSHGYLKRLLILQTLMVNANLYLFDEPLDGLDEEFRSRFINILISLKNQGKTIIIVTHDLKIFKTISDYLIYVCCGKIVGCLKINNLRFDKQKAYELIITEVENQFLTKDDSTNSYKRNNSVKIETIDKLFITVSTLLENKMNISQIFLKNSNESDSPKSN
jgi:ABC-type multidrug transport system ATPase subunit